MRFRPMMIVGALALLGASCGDAGRLPNNGRNRGPAPAPVYDPIICQLPRDAGQTVLPGSKVCDGTVDCDGADDEIDCPEQFVCPPDGPWGVQKAFPASAWCDGNVDCAAATDERDCGDRKQVVCRFRDLIDFESVSRDQFCDGKVDCMQLAFRDGVSLPVDGPMTKELRGYDELDCPGEFVCSWISESDGLLMSSVIDATQQCDGRWDCMTDEFDCLGEDRFRCSDGRTIAASEVCDEIGQCPGATDESDALCPGRFQCDESADLYSLDYNKFTYSVALYGPRFIPIDKKCDGTKDCKRGEDEDRYWCQ